MSAQSVNHLPHSSSCIPDSPGKVAAVAFAVVLAASLALFVTHTLPQNPNLLTTYYCVFGATLGITGIAFILSCILTVKKSCSSGPSTAPTINGSLSQGKPTPATTTA